MQIRARQKGSPSLFSEPLDGIVYSWCPTMDLLAVSTKNGQLLSLYRANGFKVYELEVKTAKCVEWKPDGKQMCVTTVDDVATLYDVNTKRVLSTLHPGEGTNLARWVIMGAPPNGKKFAGKLDTDILKFLPRLPPLPQSHGNTFTTKHAIETMIQNDQSDDMDLLFLFGEKDVNVTLHGLFSLGRVTIIESLIDDEEIVNCEPHTREDHYILTSSFTTMTYTLRRFKTDFVSNHDFFTQITTTSSKFIAILGYVEEVLVQLGTTIRSYLEGHNRYLNVLRNELKDHGMTAGEELYTLLLTGMMNDQLKDWIQNTIADRNIKKWTSSGETVYNNTRRIFLYHLFPALERLIILLNHLDAMCKSSMTLTENFEIKFLRESVEAVKALMVQIVGDIIKLNKEQQLFSSFMLWLQFTFMELQDDNCTIEYSTSMVSDYITNHFERPDLTTIVPLSRRGYNQIKINSQDMFDSIKSRMRENVRGDSDFQVSLGRVTEKQHMKFIGNSLFVFSYHTSTLDIHKVDVITGLVSSTSVQFSSGITDVQVAEDTVLVVSQGRIVGFGYQYLFNQPSHTEDSLTLVANQSLKGLQTTQLALNPKRKIGCAVAIDLQNYAVFATEP